MGNTRVSVPDTSTTSKRQTGTWLRVVLVLLIGEKLIQHVAVTVALMFDLRGIRTGLALDYRFFLVAGAFESLLLVFGGWGVLWEKPWARWLLLALALIDIVGELIAQGTLMIRLNVSIVVAVILLVASLLYRQTTRHRLKSVAAN